MVADPDGHGEVDLKKSLPPLWKGKYVGHFYKLDDTDPNNLATLFTPDFIAENELSHLALLESDMTQRQASYLFNGETITHNAAVLWFSEKRNKYYFFHCAACARGVAQWMTENQIAWSKNALPATSTTVN
jgi:hypothetical protein